MINDRSLPATPLWHVRLEKEIVQAAKSLTVFASERSAASSHCLVCQQPEGRWSIIGCYYSYVVLSPYYPRRPRHSGRAVSFWPWLSPAAPAETPLTLLPKNPPSLSLHLDPAAVRAGSVRQVPGASTLPVVDDLSFPLPKSWAQRLTAYNGRVASGLVLHPRYGGGP